MLNKLARTNDDYALTIARLVLGVLFFVHGDQLMLGWFGGLMLVVGFWGRVAALSIICLMAVAVVKVHWQFGLFMNWFGTKKGEGFEYHLLAITLGVVIALRGSGALSLDRLLARLRGSVPVEIDNLAAGAHAP